MMTRILYLDSSSAVWRRTVIVLAYFSGFLQSAFPHPQTSTLSLSSSSSSSSSVDHHHHNPSFSPSQQQYSSQPFPFVLRSKPNFVILSSSSPPSPSIILSSSSSSSASHPIVKQAFQRRSSPLSLVRVPRIPIPQRSPQEDKDQQEEEDEEEGSSWALTSEENLSPFPEKQQGLWSLSSKDGNLRFLPNNEEDVVMPLPMDSKTPLDTDYNSWPLSGTEFSWPLNGLSAPGPSWPLVVPFVHWNYRPEGHQQHHRLARPSHKQETEREDKEEEEEEKNNFMAFLLDHTILENLRQEKRDEMMHERNSNDEDFKGFILPRLPRQEDATAEDVEVKGKEESWDKEEKRDLQIFSRRQEASETGKNKKMKEQKEMKIGKTKEEDSMVFQATPSTERTNLMKRAISLWVTLHPLTAVPNHRKSFGRGRTTAKPQETTGRGGRPYGQPLRWGR